MSHKLLIGHASFTVTKIQVNDVIITVAVVYCTFSCVFYSVML